MLDGWRVQRAGKAGRGSLGVGVGAGGWGCRESGGAGRQDEGVQGAWAGAWGVPADDMGQTGVLGVRSSQKTISLLYRITAGKQGWQGARAGGHKPRLMPGHRCARCHPAARATTLLLRFSSRGCSRGPCWEQGGFLPAPTPHSRGVCWAGVPLPCPVELPPPANLTAWSPQMQSPSPWCPTCCSFPCPLPG